MKLFHGWLSSASRRVRLFLEEKGLPYESVAIDMGKQEQHSAAYLAMNPNGVVPASLGAEGHPRVNDWWVRVRQRPAFKKARFDRFDETLRARQVGTAG